eukprot:TRINITY_DN583_c0_g3_i1.p1 TRINITY_DN583_c0_g3~~TRINITY_DN583_c0_g3_i1.p1  ORF type:complete len:989 (+),score=332.84 TRINITY_DN583_c0_g3_i1:288-3254(+)
MNSIAESEKRGPDQHSLKVHEYFMSELQRHSSNFLQQRAVRLSSKQKIAQEIHKRAKKLEKDKQKSKDQEDRARIKALKMHDMDAYLKLVQSTKNERLEYLLVQTKMLMAQYAARITKQKTINAETGTVGLTKARKQRQQRIKEEKEMELNLESDSESGEDDEMELTTKKKENQMYMKHQSAYHDAVHDIKEVITRQPEMLRFGILKNYQLKGLEWLVSLYNNQCNGILADEMGLGKTIQTIALLCYLMEVKHNSGPFLVVVPLSTLGNWASEFAKWSPDIRVVSYKGNKNVRKQLRAEEIDSGNYHVLLTTYDYIMKDKTQLRKTTWEYIIIDEGHRMKNANCKFSLILGQEYQSRHRLLLTGTPLQNSLPELWSLLNFLMPDTFHCVDDFEQWFSQPFANFSDEAHESQKLNQEENMLVINSLHEVLRPLIFRRLKKNVLDQLPKKKELVIRCEMSPLQKFLYETIAKDGMVKLKGRSRSLKNILMQLRKTCNHPYLFEEYILGYGENLIRASGKVELLNRILPKMKRTGHRVLIFSQMKKVLNLLEYFLHFKEYRFLRLDGDTPQDARPNLIAQFNAPDSPYFVFLLSTRAGGLGVNLATADTVITFDKDWNPTMDEQAQDRAHRIGQTQEVRVFTLSSNAPAEMRVLERAQSKSHMGKLVIDGGMFNQKASVSDRRQLLEQLVTIPVDSTGDDEIPDDAQLNEMLARDEAEWELFEQMDREAKILENAQKAEGHEIRSRLLPMEEVPDDLKTPEVVTENQDMMIDGVKIMNGRRKRNVVNYMEYTDEDIERIYEAENSGDQDWKAPVSRKRSRSRAVSPAPSLQSAIKHDIGLEPSSDEDVETSAANERMRSQMNAEFMNVWKDVVNHDDGSGNDISFIFMQKPDRKLYPEYYQMIKNVICFEDIRFRISQNAYCSIAEFRDDMELIFKNCRQFNLPTSQICLDAGTLEKAFRKSLNKHKSALVNFQGVKLPPPSKQARKRSKI